MITSWNCRTLPPVMDPSAPPPTFSSLPNNNNAAHYHHHQPTRKKTPSSLDVLLEHALFKKYLPIPSTSRCPHHTEPTAMMNIDQKGRQNSTTCCHCNATSSLPASRRGLLSRMEQRCISARRHVKEWVQQDVFLCGLKEPTHTDRETAMKKEKKNSTKRKNTN